MKLLFRLFIPLICSVYLSLIIGQHLHTILSKYVFLGILFLWLFSTFSTAFYVKYIVGQPFSKKETGIAIVLSLIITFAGRSYLVPKTKTHDNASVILTALGEKNKDASSSEVWITAVSNGGAGYDLNKIVIDSLWERKANAIASFKFQPAVLKILISDAAAPAITFLSHPWSGKVNIRNGESNDTIDLYKSGANGEYIYTVKNITTVPDANSLGLKILYFALTFVFFAVLSYYIFILTSRNSK